MPPANHQHQPSAPAMLEWGKSQSTRKPWRDEPGAGLFGVFAEVMWAMFKEPARRPEVSGYSLSCSSSNAIAPREPGEAVESGGAGGKMQDTHCDHQAILLFPNRSDAMHFACEVGPACLIQRPGRRRGEVFHFLVFLERGLGCPASVRARKFVRSGFVARRRWPDEPCLQGLGAQVAKKRIKKGIRALVDIRAAGSSSACSPLGGNGWREQRDSRTGAGSTPSAW